MTPTVTAKLAGMRKAREWSVMPTSDDRILVQTIGAVGIFDWRTGAGRLCTRGGYFPHLAVAKAFTFSAEFVIACLRVCPSLGGETVLCDGMVIVEHTAQVIGQERER